MQPTPVAPDADIGSDPASDTSSSDTSSSEAADGERPAKRMAARSGTAGKPSPGNVAAKPRATRKLPAIGDPAGTDADRNEAQQAARSAVARSAAGGAVRRRAQDVAAARGKGKPDVGGRAGKKDRAAGMQKTIGGKMPGGKAVSAVGSRTGDNVKTESVEAEDIVTQADGQRAGKAKAAGKQAARPAPAKTAAAKPAAAKAATAKPGATKKSGGSAGAAKGSAKASAGKANAGKASAAKSRSAKAGKAANDSSVPEVRKAAKGTIVAAQATARRTEDIAKVASARSDAAARKAAKPANDSAQDTGFEPDDFIVYPTHGVGRILAIEVQEISGHHLRLMVIEFEKDKMTLRVPLAKVDSVGIRKLSSPQKMKTAMETLKGRARVKRTMWSRRAQEYEAKINSGDPVSIAEVVRDLHRNAGQPDQSYSERQIYEAALDRLARELAAIERIDEEQATKRLEDVLAA